MKRISGNNKNIAIEKVVINGVVTTNQKDIAQGLNEYFIDKVKQLQESMPTPTINLYEQLKDTPTPNEPHMDLMTITEHQLNKLINKMKKNASAGSDTINGRVIADLYNSLKQIILHMINLSLATSIFPDILKKTKIIPQPKQGKDPTKCEAYRPVSNLCVLGKLLENAMFDQITTFMNDTKKIHPDQHGGRSGHSTTTCIIELMENIHEAKEAKLKVGMLAVDMSSAYDLCQHNVMLEKCRLLSMGENTCKWLSHFLDGRSQFVEIGGYGSKTIRNGKYGVIQGGPGSGKLFGYYTNDLPAQVNSKRPQTNPSHTIAKEFVDDTSIVAKGKTIEEVLDNLQKDYMAVYEYLVNHSMAINVEKTQMMIINPPKNNNIQLTLNNCIIKNQRTMKILGITLSNELSFDTHLWDGQTNVIKSMYTKIALLKTVKPFISKEALANVGAALINSTILYGAPIWGNTTQANIDRVQKVQVKAARLIEGKGWCRKSTKGHRQTLLNNLNWPNVKQIISSSILNLTKKAIMNESSRGINNLFQINHPLNPRKTKKSRITHKGSIKRDIHTLSGNATQMYNALPERLKSKDLSASQFKRQLKGFMRNKKLLEKH